MTYELRKFRMKDLLECNPSIGASIVQHWARQGYLVHGTEQRGSREYLTFSLSELIYVSILVRLSWFGALNKKTLVFLIPPPGTDTGPDNMVSLATPEPFLNQLKELEWDVLLHVTAEESDLASATRRSKQFGILYAVHTARMKDLPGVMSCFEKWTDTDLLINVGLLKQGVESKILKGL